MTDVNYNRPTLDLLNHSEEYLQSPHQEKSHNIWKTSPENLIETDAFLDQTIVTESVCALHIEHPKQTADKGSINNIYLCNFCSYSAPSSDLIVDHCKQHRFGCGNCEFETFSRVRIFQHLKNEHKLLVKNISRSSVYICSLVEKLLPFRREDEIPKSDNMATNAHEVDQENTSRNSTLKNKSTNQELCLKHVSADDYLLDFGCAEVNCELQVKVLEEASVNTQGKIFDNEITSYNSSLKQELEDEESWKISLNTHNLSGDEDNSDKDFEIKIEKPDSPVYANETFVSYSCAYSFGPQCTKTASESMCSDEQLDYIPKVQSNSQTSLKIAPDGPVAILTPGNNSLYHRNVHNSGPVEVNNQSAVEPNDSSPVQMVDNGSHMPKFENKSEVDYEVVMYWKCAYCMFYADKKDTLAAHIRGCHVGKQLKFIESTVPMILENVDELTRLLNEPKCWKNIQIHNNETKWYSARENTILKCGCCCYDCTTVADMKNHMLENHLGQALFAIDFRARFSRVYFCVKKNCCFATQSSAVYKMHTPRCIGKTEYTNGKLQRLYIDSIRHTMDIASTVTDTLNSSERTKYYCCPYCAFFKAGDSSFLMRHIISNHSGKSQLMKVFSVVETVKIYDRYFCGICLEKFKWLNQVLRHGHKKEITEQSNDQNIKSACQNIKADGLTVEESSLVKKSLQINDIAKDRDISSETKSKEQASNKVLCQDQQSHESILGLSMNKTEEKRYPLSAYKPFLDIVYPFVVSRMPLDIRNSMSIKTLHRFLEKYDILLPVLYECIACDKLLGGTQLMKQHLIDHFPAPSCAVDFLKHKRKEADYLVTLCPVDGCDFTGTIDSNLKNHVRIKHGPNLFNRYRPLLLYKSCQIKLHWERKTGKKTEMLDKDDGPSDDPHMVSESKPKKRTKRPANNMDPPSTSKVPKRPEDGSEQQVNKPIPPTSMCSKRRRKQMIPKKTTTNKSAVKKEITVDSSN